MKKARRPWFHASVNLLVPLSETSVSLTNSRTASAGMTKLKPWTSAPSGPGASETKVSTPRTCPFWLTAGPPELPKEADASVWITG